MGEVRDRSDPVKAAYETPDDYEVRVRTHELYSVVKQGWPEWLIEQMPRAGVRSVLDLGCGTGGLLRLIAAAGIGSRWLGMDQSQAMVQKAQRLADEAGLPIEYRCGDILDPSGNEGEFDLVCACHVIYHMADIDAAIGQCVRRLAPGGTFVATTNSRDTMFPYFEAVWCALRERFPQIKLDSSPVPRFSLENGAEFLMRHFDRIELRVRRDALRFRSPTPWAAYLKSGRHLRMPEGHTDEEWTEVSRMIDRTAAEQFTEEVLVVPKLGGTFLCSMPCQDRSSRAR